MSIVLPHIGGATEALHLEPLLPAEQVWPFVGRKEMHTDNRLWPIRQRIVLQNLFTRSDCITRKPSFRSDP